MSMSEKQFLKNLPKENKEFYAKQIKDNSKANAPNLPKTFFMQGFKIKSLNVLLTSHWASRKRYKEACVNAMTLAGALPVNLPKEKRSVLFERIRPPRGKPMDDDNLKAGFKYLRDNFTTLGYLVDDTNEWIDAKEVDRKPEEWESWGIKITIKEIK